MKILLVEDGEYKAKAILNKLRVKGDHHVTHVKDALSARRKLNENRGKYDLILLDMSIPYENQPQCPVDTLGGMKILEAMESKDDLTPVIVITQYSDFQNTPASSLIAKSMYKNINYRPERRSNELDMSNYAMFDSNMTIEGIHQQMSIDYCNYLGTIYYSSIDNNWKESLDELIKEV